MIETALFTLDTRTDGFAGAFDLRALNRWTLAVCQAAQFFPRVALVTDARGAYLLRDRLGLPFTDVIEELEVPARLSHLVCAAKLWGYRAMVERRWPFLAIDGDVFLWRRPEERLLAAPAVAQDQREIAPGLGAVIRQLGEIHPRMVRGPWTCCAGLLGGNNVRGLKGFVDQGIELLTDYRSAAVFREARARWYPVSACEEALFVARFGSRIEYFTGRDAKRADFDRAGFTHLNGAAKHDPVRELQVESRVAWDWPEYRPRIARLWWEELSLQMPARALSEPLQPL